MRQFKVLILLVFSGLSALASDTRKPGPVNLPINVKIFLQGAYSSSLGRHKDVSSAWASVLNTYALNQPYSASPWNYSGTQSVASSFFTSNSGSTTDIVDWVLIELRDGNDPSIVSGTTVGFVQEDGQVVGTNGTGLPYIRYFADPTGYYYIVIKHRNHLAIRTPNAVFLDPTITPTQYDFTTAQSQAYQNPNNTANSAMADLGNGVFGLHAGDANSVRGVRYTGPSNDALAILAALGANQAAILNSVYRAEDVNMDGIIRYTGPNNDILALLSYLGANQAAIYITHL